MNSRQKTELSKNLCGNLIRNSQATQRKISNWDLLFGTSLELCGMSFRFPKLSLWVYLEHLSAVGRGHDPKAEYQSYQY